ncbi:MAG: hypothetical protein LBU65_08780 [Planctomycetaceae bacterium]|jgi:hypothetical protein|nr:hypothetical protein [Planctomycetaceae bacterium]
MAYRLLVVLLSIVSIFLYAERNVNSATLSIKHAFYGICRLFFSTVFWKVQIPTNSGEDTILVTPLAFCFI